MQKIFHFWCISHIGICILHFEGCAITVQFVLDILPAITIQQWWDHHLSIPEHCLLGPGVHSWPNHSLCAWNVSAKFLHSHKKAVQEEFTEPAIFSLVTALEWLRNQENDWSLHKHTHTHTTKKVPDPTPSPELQHPFRFIGSGLNSTLRAYHLCHSISSSRKFG